MTIQFLGVSESYFKELLYLYLIDQCLKNILDDAIRIALVRCVFSNAIPYIIYLIFENVAKKFLRICILAFNNVATWEI